MNSHNFMEGSLDRGQMNAGSIGEYRRGGEVKIWAAEVQRLTEMRETERRRGIHSDVGGAESKRSRVRVPRTAAGELGELELRAVRRHQDNLYAYVYMCIYWERRIGVPIGAGNA